MDEVPVESGVARTSAAPPGSDTAALVLRTRRRLGRVLTAANAAFGVLAAVLGILVVPAVEAPRGGGRLALNLLVFVGLLTVIAAHALRWSARRQRRGWSWAGQGRAPSEDEHRLILRTPLATAYLTAAQWTVAIVVFAVINAPSSPRFAASIAITLFFTGLAMCAVAYLLSEIILRPVAAMMLAARPADEPVLLGVLPRQTLGWLLGTGSAVAGLLSIGVIQLADPRATAQQLAVTVVVFCMVALVGGLVLQVLGARAVAGPLRRLREATARVGGGDLRARVEVDDATDVGQLQVEFNRMAEGLEERERLRDVFGRHVGDDVARYALGRDGTALGGVTRDVGVLFVDLTGSTALAASRPPAEVVAVLNRFFAVVVDAVDAFGGSINKFEGDAALAVFGAPDDLEDPAGAALGAARTMSEALAAEVPELGFGIGVASGPAVAGNVGSEQRFEYTVIGDPVNEAARLSDLAKTLPGGVAASGHAVVASSNGAREQHDGWRADREVVLRGRDAPTVVMVPVASDHPPRGVFPPGTS